MPDAPMAPLSPPPSAGRRVLRALRYVVAGAILCYLLTRVDLAGVGAALRRAEATWLAVACAASLLLQWAIALRLKCLTDGQGMTLPLATLFEINLATTFYGLFLPGGNFAGLAVRFLRLGQRGGDLTGAGVALFIDRIVATISLCLVGMAFWLLERRAGTLGVFLVMAACAALLMLLCVAITARWPLPQAIERWTGKLMLALARWRGMSTAAHANVLLLGVLTHIIGIAVFVCLARAVGIPIGIVSLGWVRSAVILATMIPISVAGLGLREGAMLVMLAAYGIDDTHALAMSLLVFAVVMLLPGLIGGAFEARRLLLR